LRYESSRSRELSNFKISDVQSVSCARGLANPRYLHGIAPVAAAPEQLQALLDTKLDQAHGLDAVKPFVVKHVKQRAKNRLATQVYEQPSAPYTTHVKSTSPALEAVYITCSPGRPAQVIAVEYL
jgi:hypothetical protein